MAIKQDHISVTVKSFASLREVMDNQVRLVLPEGATIHALLRDLTSQYEGLYDMLFSNPDTLRDYVNILKNGRNIQFLAGLGTSLDDGDVIALFPPAAGG